MKLSAPKKIVWLIALLIAVLVMVVKYVPGLSELVPPIISNNLFWAMTVSYVLLLLGTTFKGL
ncbi:MAG: hypothetical protein AB1Z23_05025 [Eubacteriales bacterium]